MLDRESVEQSLRGLLNSPKLVSSPQMTAFVSYVVAQTLDRNHARIKAFTIGVEALGKPDGFDPQSDASVRVLAGRLRKVLDSYNESLPPGATIIRLLKGTYVPEFGVKSEMLEAHREQADPFVDLHATQPTAETHHYGGVGQGKPPGAPIVRRAVCARTR